MVNKRYFVLYIQSLRFFFSPVTMQAQKEAPPDMQCRDKFLLQSVVVSSGVTGKDITPEMVSYDPFCSRAAKVDNLGSGNFVKVGVELTLPYMYISSTKNQGIR